MSIPISKSQNVSVFGEYNRNLIDIRLLQHLSVSTSPIECKLRVQLCVLKHRLDYLNVLN